MSLLLEARKKSQQAQAAQVRNSTAPASKFNREDSPVETGTKANLAGYATQVEEAARNAGKNLFKAKSVHSPSGHTLPNQYLLPALGCTILLAGMGAGYFWYIASSNNTTPLRPASAPPVTPIPQPQTATASKPGIAAQQPALVPGINKASRDDDRPLAAPPVAAPVKSAPIEFAQPRESSPIHIKRPETELLDPLLGNAYIAYRNGKLDEAQQLYLSIFKKDAHNADALLGLAAIAQQLGDTRSAVQYYGRVLELDPRNPVANAGMAALTADDGHNESRLKNLLREHDNSAVMHFALGNLYAGQSRWGEAQQAYFNAYTLESGNAEFAFNLAVSLEHLGQTKLAAQHYQRALQLDSSQRAGFDHAQISQRIAELNR